MIKKYLLEQIINEAIKLTLAQVCVKCENVNVNDCGCDCPMPHETWAGDLAKTLLWKRPKVTDNRRYIIAGRECRIIIRPGRVGGNPTPLPGRIRIPTGGGKKTGPRNCLIEYLDTHERVVRPFRGLRRVKDDSNED